VAVPRRQLHVLGHLCDSASASLSPAARSLCLAGR
jgi:hypothetical protein